VKNRKYEFHFLRGAKMNKNKLLFLFISVLFFSSTSSILSAADVLSGRVYEGNKGTDPPTSTAISGVTVKLYGSNNSDNLGTQISSTTTDNQGWYGLTATVGYEYYTIIETDPSGYYSIGATSVDGTVINNNRIRYSVANEPLSNQTLTGNKFWDKPDTPANNPPNADANGPYTGTVGQSITLDGSGSSDPDAGDSIVSYEWDLDNDGQYDDATGVNPSHTWNSPTTTTIRLKVTDSHGASDTDNTTVTINEQPPECDVNFSASPRSGCAPLNIEFYDQSNNAQSWKWTFTGGSPSSSTQQNPTVTYSTPGTYGVKLRITCTSGAVDSLYKNNYITVDNCQSPCDAAFDAAPRQGCATLKVNFSAQTSNAQTWYWTFWGGNPSNSSQQNPTVAYSTPGSYNVMLVVICADGAIDSLFRRDFIIVDNCQRPCEAAFDASPRDGCAPLTVNFTDQTNNAQSWQWIFPGGNPSSSALQNPSVIYTTSGSYGVQLRVTCESGAVDSLYRTDYITVRDCGQQEMDFGDAPDPLYPTLFVNDGARHIIDPDVYLGTKIDSEADGQPSSGASADDNDGNDDEDGIVFQNNLVPGGYTSFVATVSMNGHLGVWVDFNGNGSWADPGESIFDHDTTVFAGANMWGFLVPQTATLGNTVARFRYSTVSGGLDFDGEWPDGEVEDYLVEIQTEGTEDSLDFGDAQDPTYPTLFQNNGARHIIKSNIYLGSSVDADPNGQPDGNALGDDNDGNDDDDGVLWSWLLLGDENDILVDASATGYLNAWLDLNLDGDWSDSGEQIFSDESLTAGSNLLKLTIPTSSTPGNSTARFRFSKSSGLSYIGLAPDGEVEDRKMKIMLADYGDAPDQYPTLLVNNGARHIPASNYHLGVSLDEEADGLPSSNALGDDNNLSDDEDGVVFPTTLIQGTNVTITVNTQMAILNGDGYLNAWIDFNRDMDWSDAGEQIFSDVLLNHGTQTLNFNIPVSASDGNTYARFRLSENTGTSFDGVVQYGEVEDYMIQIGDGGDNGEIRGVKWNDLNGNGIKEAGEPGIPNWKIIVDYNQDGVLDPFSSGDFTTTTNSLGEYKFTNYFNGSYIVGEILKSGWQQTYPDSSYGSRLGNVGPYDHMVILNPGQVVADIDFGNNYEDAEDGYDFGDAPDPHYPTLLINNGARHTIKQGFYLGAGIDAETNGHPSALADGDNTNGINDEDGVLMPFKVSPGQAIPITVTASDSGALNAWFDFNVDGDWADTGEKIIASQPVITGANTFTINVPGNAVLGQSYVRFRFSSVRNVSYDGPAPDGEVEDYQVEISTQDIPAGVSDFVWNDLNRNGIQDPGEPGIANVWVDIHDQSNTPWMGTSTDAFGNYYIPNLPAGNYYLDFYSSPGTIYTFSPMHQGSDPTKDSDANSSGRTNLFTLVGGLWNKDIDAGMYLEGDGDNLDFGDAPDPTYPTLSISNGARHLVTPNLYLGNSIDPETDGQPTIMADGDDKNILFTGSPHPPGDEDGVQIPPIITPGGTVTVNVIASAPGVLNAWLDFNVNGSWAEAGEHIIAAQPVVAGVNSFTINVPTTVVTGQSYARFRLSSVRNISYDGLAPDGEVEDYAVAIKDGDGGNFTVIKEATPKDNTPFWITIVYGGSGSVPLRDPSMNLLNFVNVPLGTYYINETVTPGWNLTDIVITGDSDNGSFIDVPNAKIDMDLDANENITVVFKNRKTGDDDIFDLGDAPDGTNHSGLPMDAYPGIPAHFPTVHDAATGMLQGTLHIHPREQVYLGRRVSLEFDADIGADEDPTNNIVPQNSRSDFDYHDDGVTLPLLLPACGTTSFDFRVTVAQAATKQNFFINVWFDWNRDGDWEDLVPCNGNQTSEWAVRNQAITLNPGTHVVSTQSFMSTHPAFTGTPPPIWMRIMITTLASDTDDGSGPASGYAFGETEDYYFVPRLTDEVGYDFGDAPDNSDAPGYPTLRSNGGAYHVATDGFHLGGLIDGESDGQPTTDAAGDDQADMDDEDGVFFPTPLVLDQQAMIEVVASADGILNAWIDYSANMSWNDADEHVFIDIPLIAGNNPLTFHVPSTVVPGQTFARFRFSRIEGILVTGYGHAGEVEDYEVGIVEGGECPPIKWNQIPLINEDPEMPYTPYFMGWDQRSEYDGTFVADDWFCKSPLPVTDIHWVGSYTEWDSAFPPPVAPHAFHLGVWTDVPKDEDNEWSHPGEMIWEWIVPRELLNERVIGNNFHPEYMTKPDTCFQYDFFIPEDEWFHQEGDSTIYWISIAAIYEDYPDSLLWGWKTREHFFHDDAVLVYEPVQPTVGDVTITTEPIAEGWDMVFVMGTHECFLEFDFGDAPAERFPTFFGQNGALHIIDPRVFLGHNIDPEIDGQPHHESRGDDLDGMDDDDGIIFITPTDDDPSTYVEIRASMPGFLNAWMDFNNNGTWADPEDQIFFDEPLPGGTSTLSIDVPDDAVQHSIFSRFRFSTEPGLPFVGIAIDGEVEDYLIDITGTDVKAADNDITQPRAFRLYQNFPNPFNASTEICYDLPESGFVQLSVYNLMGIELLTLVKEKKTAGYHRIKWDGKDDQNNQLPSGIYIYQLKIGKFSSVKKLISLK
jgi:PKD repeat protein